MGGGTRLGLDYLCQRLNTAIGMSHSMGVSNFPGPHQKLYFCGQKVTDFQVSLNTTLPTFVFFRYADFMHVTLSCDGSEVDFAHTMMNFLTEELDLLLSLSGVTPGESMLPK